ncbi:MAG TPA: aldose 1-epimerase [Bryobacteraceae bacterium]|nr:aldose 1-epimerase [Bryobacteraceae bacterium]
MRDTYSAQRVSVDSVDVVRLEDRQRNIRVSIAPSVGNNAYEMAVNDRNIFWFPYGSVREFRDKPVMLGNIFLAPWANRLDSEGYWANGKRFTLNPGLANYQHDPNGLPIHGLLRHTSAWQVTGMRADEAGAEVTSGLQFWRYPEFMAQFPFAHELEMTYRLANGALEVRTVVANVGSEPMPLSLGYHPYFTIADAPRDEWTVQIPAAEHVSLSDRLIPTGERSPREDRGPFSLRGRALDDVYTALEHDTDFFVRGHRQQIALRYGARYAVAVVYAPQGKDFICFEPMTGPTNAFNLAHEGVWKDVQTIPPGGRWEESFWIQPSGDEE